jgi:two-component system sensor histidine kinase CpxA
MRSLFAKILLWFLATITITFIGLVAITAMSINDPGRQLPMRRLVAYQLQEARVAYETGGSGGLQSYLDKFDRLSGAEGFLTDATGRDLVTGQDRSGLIAGARRPFLLRRSRAIVAHKSNDGRYWFVVLVPTEGSRLGVFLRDQLWILAAAILLCYALALHLTSPLRRLQNALERFGHGDFSARAGSHRRDELGQLARTFDQMAERIQTLHAAERRLLLDISHELRSPLARLGVAVELARSGGDRDASLNRIQKEADRLNSLVGQLLQVTRAEGDPGSLRSEPVRLDELVADVVNDCSIEAQARHCSLEWKGSAPVTTTGDPELLRRATENVIRNAIRYAPEKTPVQVSIEPNGSKATVRVRDYGPGVPPESLSRIFDPFYRVESDRNRANGGVGLGLSIARRAIELHKGKLVAHNADPGLLVEMEVPVRGAGQG